MYNYTLLPNSEQSHDHIFTKDYINMMVKLHVMSLLDT